LTPTREEFLYFSLPEKLLFYGLVYLSLAYMVWQFWQRGRLWMTGRPIETSDPPSKAKWLPSSPAAKRWFRNVLVYVLEQKKVRSSRPKSGAPMHLAIFYGFVTLLLATTLLAINTYSPVKFHKGTYYLVYEMTADCMGVVFVIGIVWAFLRRGLSKAPLTRAPADYWTLALLLTLALTGYWT